MIDGLSRFADALMAIGHYAERRNCNRMCGLCRDDAWGSYCRTEDIDPRAFGLGGSIIPGFCPDESESARRLKAAYP